MTQHREAGLSKKNCEGRAVCSEESAEFEKAQCFTCNMKKRRE